MSVAVNSDSIEQRGRSQHAGQYGEISESFRKTANKVLSKEKSTNTISSLVENSYSFAELTISEARAKAEPPKAIQCQAGCFYCCTLMVPVIAPEIVYLVQQMRKTLPTSKLDQVIQDVQNIDNQTRGQNSVARFVNRLPCPLLVNNECIAYESRPSACRGFTSHSWLACLRDFKIARYFKYTPIVADRSQIHSAVRSGFLSALDDNGIPPQILELNAALRIAFDTSNFENRWLSGEGIFSDAVMKR